MRVRQAVEKGRGGWSQSVSGETPTAKVLPLRA
jgi:hypothetical protein